MRWYNKKSKSNQYLFFHKIFTLFVSFLSIFLFHRLFPIHFRFATEFYIILGLKWTQFLLPERNSVQVSGDKALVQMPCTK